MRLITSEMEQTLFLELEPYIKNYLKANSCTHLNGKAKSDNHVIISKILVDFIFENKVTSEIESVWRAVHSVLRDVLTDRMDEVIGFPINTPLPLDLSDLSRKFFNVIVMNNKQIEIDARISFFKEHASDFGISSTELIVDELTHSELKERFLELQANYEQIKNELFELKQPPVIKSVCNREYCGGFGYAE